MRISRFAFIASAMAAAAIAVPATAHAEPTTVQQLCDAQTWPRPAVGAGPKRVTHRRAECAHCVDSPYADGLRDSRRTGGEDSTTTQHELSADAGGGAGDDDDCIGISLRETHVDLPMIPRVACTKFLLRLSNFAVSSIDSLPRAAAEPSNIVNARLRT